MPGASSPAPASGLNLAVRNEPGRIVVTAAVPDAKDADVSVRLSDARTLTVNVGQRAGGASSGSTGSSSSSSWSQTSQTVTLPAAVHVAKMKVERKGGELVIVLPKA
jgi:HSP20 family molecular chaperone IbpA